MTTAMPDEAAPVALLSAWRDAKASDPHARTRDIAATLGVSEGMLAECRRGSDAERLALRGADCIRLLDALGAVGPLMTLTRNAAVVHETTGPIADVAGGGAIGQVTGPIDLRLFFRSWHVVYALRENTRSGLRHSIQVFDVTGAAVLKIYATGDTDAALWRRIVSDFADQGSSATAFSPPARPPADPPDDEIDRDVLRREWLALEHSHGFQAMLRALGVGRLQALRLAGDDLACRVEPAAVERMLTLAAAEGVPIMCFVGNPGCMQIFTGVVHRIAPMGRWLNVLDPTFNLHLRTDAVASVWAVTKPTSLRGAITSLELFDGDGTLVCQFFGARPPGEGEREVWRDLLARAIGGTS